MPETPDLYYEIKKIQARVDNIDNELSLTLASNKDAICFIENIFAKSKVLAQVYLRVDGKSNVSELAKKLGKNQPDVSDYLNKLHRYGLIDKDVKGGVLYQKNQYEKIFNISERLGKKFGIK